MGYALRAAGTAILVASAMAPARAQSPATAAVSIVQGSVQSVDRGRATITVRDDSGAVRRLSVARAAVPSLAGLRAGSHVILTIREGVVTAIAARGAAATPAPQEVPQLPPGASAPQNRGIPQLPPGADAPQARPIPQVPAASPAPSPRAPVSPLPVSPRPSVSPRPVSPRPDVSAPPVSPRPAVSPVTAPSPRPVPIRSPEG